MRPAIAHRADLDEILNRFVEPVDVADDPQLAEVVKEYQAKLRQIDRARTSASPNGMCL